LFALFFIPLLYIIRPNLKDNLRRTLYLTQNAVHAVALERKGFVVGCNNSFDLSDKNIAELIDASPREIKIVMPAIEDQTGDKWDAAVDEAHALRERLEAQIDAMRAQHQTAPVPQQVEVIKIAA